MAGGGPHSQGLCNFSASCHQRAGTWRVGECQEGPGHVAPGAESQPLATKYVLSDACGPQSMVVPFVSRGLWQAPRPAAASSGQQGLPTWTGGAWAPVRPHQGSGRAADCGLITSDDTGRGGTACWLGSLRVPSSPAGMLLCETVQQHPRGQRRGLQSLHTTSRQQQAMPCASLGRAESSVHSETPFHACLPRLTLLSAVQSSSGCLPLRAALWCSLCIRIYEDRGPGHPGGDQTC